MSYGKIAIACFGAALAAGIAWAQSPSEAVDHSKMDHAAMGHGPPAAADGPWSYTGRKNPAPYEQGRWDMVPVPQYGHMFISTEKLTPELRCAALRGNPRVMVDRATREACDAPEQRTPAAAPAPSGGSAATADAGHTHDHHHGATMAHDHWMAPAEAMNRKNPIAATGESVERGRKLYAANCASCHGQSGAGDGPAGMALEPRPTNLRAMAGRHPDGDYAWKIANGRGPMPAWKGTFTENQIWDLVNFIQRWGDAAPHSHHPGHSH